MANIWRMRPQVGHGMLRSGASFWWQKSKPILLIDFSDFIFLARPF